MDINQIQTEDQSFLTHTQTMEERIWVDSNISKVDEILRINYDKSVNEFSEIVLTTIADLVDALRGAFYIVNHDKKRVSATAGYACTIKTMIKNEFQIGEDLVGFAVKSKKMRYIDDLPINNATTRTGLANVSSTTLIISPLVFNDVVYGVIELNNLKKLEPKQIELVERLSRNIASTLQSILNNEKTKSILDELREKTRAMEAQEEELRQNMEELAAIRDEMERKQDELLKTNEQMQRNSDILKKAVESGKDKEKQLREKEGQIKQREIEIKEIEQKLKRFTGSIKDIKDVEFEDIFDLVEFQQLQDSFAASSGVASIVTRVDGTPLTKPSNFSYLCEHVIRCTDKGLANCTKSDAELGTKVKGGAAVQPCLSGGLWDGGTGIFIGDKQIANWLIGQVLTDDVDEEKFMEYAKEIDAEEAEFRKGLAQVTRMPVEKFRAISDFLYQLASYISQIALRNYSQARELANK